MNFNIFIVGLLFIVILYLIAIMPRMGHRPDVTPFQGRYYAHRGLHNNNTDAPENSKKAFELAVKGNYGIELDIQLTKDNIPVVFHDYNLKRVCGMNRKVSEMTYEELQKLSLYQSKERIPHFKEVLNLIDGKVPIIMELKIPWKAHMTCKKAEECLKDYQGIYCMESFNPFGLIWYKKNHPKIMRGQLSTNFFKDKEEGNKVKFVLLQNLLLNFLAKPDFIAYHYIHRNKLSFVLCTKLYKAYSFAWTIRSQQALEESRRSFEFFIFDSFVPDRE